MTNRPRANLRRFSQTRRKAWLGLLFIAPWLIGFFLFTARPLWDNIIYSFNQITFPLTGIKRTPVGILNYTTALFKDENFTLALPGYLKQLFLTVPMILVFSVLLALLLNTKLKFRRLFRALFFLPVIIMSGPVVSSLQAMGAVTLNGVTSFPVYIFIGRALPGFLSMPILYVFDNFILFLWFSGVQILIFLSGLQKVSPAIYEASMVDGASAWQQFWKITMPTLKPFIFLNAIYTIVDVSMASTNPIISLIKDKMFAPINGGFGISAALSWVYFVVILVAVLLVWLFFGRGEKEERARTAARTRARSQSEARAKTRKRNKDRRIESENGSAQRQAQARPADDPHKPDLNGKQVK